MQIVICTIAIMGKKPMIPMVFTKNPKTTDKITKRFNSINQVEVEELNKIEEVSDNVYEIYK